MTSTQSDPALQLVVQGEVADTVAIGLVGFIGSMIEAPPEGHGQSSGEQLAIATRIEETRSSLLRRVLAIFGAMMVTQAFRFEISAARVAGYVAAIVMFAFREDPWRYAFDRAWETLVGIGSALVVGLVPLGMRTEAEKRD